MPGDIADHYTRNAHAFDTARRRQFVERGWLDRFLLGLPPGPRILDLGCGGGEPIARYLIDRGAAMTGVDIAPPMVTLARARFGRHRWLQGDMRTVAVDGPFDGIIAWDSLFHLPAEDHAPLLARLAALLAPGGALLFNAGPAAGEACGEQFGEPLYHASLAPADYRSIFAAHGLSEVAFVPADAGSGGRSVWLARRD
ncbi:methyltransferase domain-containing protein [Sphingomonas sp. RS6]